MICLMERMALRTFKNICKKRGRKENFLVLRIHYSIHSGIVVLSIYGGGKSPLRCCPPQPRTLPN